MSYSHYVNARFPQTKLRRAASGLRRFAGAAKRLCRPEYFRWHGRTMRQLKGGLRP
jgi:hypothetical protein